jgi:DNA-binding transcriptional ArsR family regulator
LQLNVEQVTGMLDSLITSKTRVRLLMKFFANSQTSAYLRSLAEEFGESSNSVRQELNRLAKANLLISENQGNKKRYQANDKHPLFPELNKLVKKYMGLSGIVEHVLQRLGTVRLALVTGDYAKGIDSGIVDLVIVGEVDRHYLTRLVERAEQETARKIRTLVATAEEFVRIKDQLNLATALVLWTGKDGEDHNGQIPSDLLEGKDTAQ